MSAPEVKAAFAFVLCEVAKGPVPDSCAAANRPSTVWFTEATPGKIGQLNPATHSG
jgi:streptogramin lyase